MIVMNKRNLIDRELCLDFANTAGWHASENPKEKLKTYNDLVTWANHAGILSEKEAKKLTGRAKREPAKAENMLQRAIELREAVYHVFSELAKGNPPSKKDMAVINLNLSRTMARSWLVQTEDGFIWSTSGGKEELDWLLDPIIRSAAELLTSDSLERVKECADDRGCGYLFLDKSRNKSRRWCDMADCGNRAKAQRFYRKIQKKRPATP